ncbi:hypothetical protein KIF53_15525 [Chromobacterium subtsugae]|uniref:Restriction endonuclease type IV Mrr domain-containing protein n=1 Tax=Chromobacterium subtsugae TaxID=251747 RepID=A0ABS7FG41_9NEIS|nr:MULTISPECIES: hypothetical protein [Chromobacterium]KUM02749.1 hypothetical protein Cv017_01470 [Chromobacterium subtsugae]KZE84966.1 hypothetical protein AWB61_03020 [Chromobacterium sp. F49]MBW7567816.1 hypothetical protein [Chromobacterium subtsugae]MBW8289043.1 hypothetical protein [Chromobacterium subtsugae]OBU85462.1 hypothetical protein MY55_15875 [Chromobacterium subtsugae]
MHPDLARLVDIAGMALEAEDRQILGAVTANRVAYSGESGGLLRFNNERFYQFIVAKSLLSSMPYKVSVEVNSHDMVLEVPDTGNHFAVVEMKRWMSPNGEQELPGIRKDIFQKLQNTTGAHKLMLLFSSNPRDQMREQMSWLLERLNLPEDSFSSYCFSTYDQLGKAVEFWIAGIEIT